MSYHISNRCERLMASLKWRTSSAFFGGIGDQARGGRRSGGTTRLNKLRVQSKEPRQGCAYVGAANMLPTGRTQVRQGFSIAGRVDWAKPGARQTSRANPVLSHPVEEPACAGRSIDSSNVMTVRHIVRCLSISARDLVCLRIVSHVRSGCSIPAHRGSH